MTTAPTMPTVAERVAAGAAWLDEHRPGWRDRVSAPDLDLQDGCGCVLGQEFSTADPIDNGYVLGLQAAGAPDFETGDEWARDHGFLWIESDNWKRDVARLTDAWIAEIERDNG